MKGPASSVGVWADLALRLALSLLIPLALFVALFVAVSASSFVAVRLISTPTSHELLGETSLLVAPHGKSKCEDGEPDCNDNTLPDTCELLANDCNENFVLDACEIASGDAFDCDENGTPDDCQPDCQPNGRLDPCDILEGFSTDLDLNGVPDDCVYVPPPNPAPYPVGINNNRYISFSVPEGGPTWDARTAIRVTFRSLHHPDPENDPEHPARDFSSLEGQVRWVGPPQSFDENEYTDATFIASSLQCEPYNRD